MLLYRLDMFVCFKEPWILYADKSIMLSVCVWLLHIYQICRRLSKVEVHCHFIGDSTLGCNISASLVWFLQLVEVVCKQHSEYT